MPISRVLAFDIGIRNLAWCAMERSHDSSARGQALSTTSSQGGGGDISGYNVIGWDNYDLLAGQSASTAANSVAHCAQCSAKATYETPRGIYCVRHCPLDKPALRDASGNLMKKLPSAAGMKSLLQSKGVAHPPKSKGDLLKKIQDYYAIPILKAKVKKALDTELSVLHDSIRRFITANKPLFSSCSTILLENQPVLKNPTMKSVQILLFATLRDLLEPIPVLKLVHAKKKVEGVQTGDAGYQERKQGSEKRVQNLLESSKIHQASTWRQHLQKYAKKNDLTDAFCMCIDYIG